MVRAHIWMRKKEGMGHEEFREYLENTHAPIARDGYEHLKGYAISVVTRVPQGQEAPYDAVAELWWGDREGFSEDMKSDAAARGTEDLKTFTSAFGLMFVELKTVK
jgi:uncharacterized protein (TIGR02118 family)